MSEMWIPAARFVAALPPDWRPQLSPAQERTVDDLRRGVQGYVSFRYADRVLVRLGLEHLWHLPEDQGGFADIYEDGADYGGPEGRTALPRPERRTYASEEERREARRASWRAYHERKKLRRAA